MTDDGPFLSRRERRAQEQREATNMPADTDALALGPISESIPTHAPDGRMLSRRERRRLERARQPMETWTAEEEMIATGQIPAMTPERIAEQEKLARERAAEAQLEAEQASAELEGIADHPAVASAEPAAEPPSQPMWAPVTQASDPAPSEPEPHENAATHDEHRLSTPSPPGGYPSEPSTPEFAAADDETSPQEHPSADETSPPERASLIAAVAADVNPIPSPVADAPTESDEQAVPTEPTGEHADEFTGVSSTPSAPEPQVEAAPSAEASAPSAFEPAVESAPAAEASAPSAFESAVESAPAAEASAPSVFESAVESAPAAETSAPSALEAPVAAVPGMPPGMSPEMFASLFPPGSLQRRLLEDQAAAEAESRSEPEPEPEPEPEGPAAEIRRLTQEAVAGLDVAGDPPRGESPAESSQPTDFTPAVAPSAQEQPAAPSPIEPGTPAPLDSASGYGFEPAPQPQAQDPSPWDVPASASESAPEHYSHQSAPSAPAPAASESAPPTFSIPTFDTAGEPEPAQPGVADEQVPSTEPSAPPVLAPLEESPFDAILGDHPHTAALDQAANTAHQPEAYRFDSVGTDTEAQTSQPPQAQQQPQSEQSAQDAHGFAPDPGASTPWAEHPLSQVDREAPELPEMPPAQSVPQPDLSSVGLRPQPGQAGQVPIVEPVPTGQIEVAPRSRPELTGADVPRSFKWAHLAVFGAVGLLLGVIVWQVA